MILVTLFAVASAATTYVCDCDASADADCIAGDDKSDGTTPATAWRSVEAARLWWAEASAGDSVLFCQGGSLAVPPISRWVADGCTAAKPCTIGPYTPDWASGDEGRPILLAIADESALRFDEPGDAHHEEGVTVTGIALRCTSCTDGGGRGIVIADDVDAVTIDGVVIDGFDVGIAIAGSAKCAADDPDCDGKSIDITISHSTIYENRSFGFIGSGNNLVLKDNTFRDNGSSFATDHNIYIDAAQSPDVGVRVDGNELSGSAPAKDETCQSTEIQVEGAHASLTVTDNRITETGTVDEDCWGISVSPGVTDLSEGFTGALIRNNTIRNVGGTGIGIAGCKTCTVENNLVVWDQSTTGVRGIAAPDRPRGDDDQPLDALDVRNNTIVTAATGTAIVVGDEGTGHVIVSNAVYYTGTAPGWNCFDANLPGSSYEDVDYNLCWFPNVTDGEWNDTWGLAPDPLSAWSDVSGFCSHCVWRDPELDEKLWAPVDATSPVVGAGHPTRSSEDDILGQARFDADIGAYEWTEPADTGDTGTKETADTGDSGSGANGGGADGADDGTGGDDDGGGCGCGHGRATTSLFGALLAMLMLRRRR